MNLTEFKKAPQSTKPHYLLFGHPIDHSWSPLMHNTALDYYNMDAEYVAIDLESQELGDLASYLNREVFLGANITIPYKQLIIEYLDEVVGPAGEIEAVNTIVKNNFHLGGYNTDSAGFVAPLSEYEDQLIGSNAIVFGTGGATRAIVVSLINIGVEQIYLISRTPARKTSFKKFRQVHIISYHEWTSVATDSLLIVNATPLGMYPKKNESPVRDSEKEYLKDHICYDIVYNPVQTKFLRQAEEMGASTISGLEMLIQQGSQSFELWTGHPFPLEIIRNRLYEQFEN